jgi:putative DNA primase/helicase
MIATLAYAQLASLCDQRLGKRDVPCPLCGPSRHAPENRKRPVLRVWHQRPGFASYHCARCGERGFAHENEPRRCARTAKAAVPGTILSPKIEVDADDLERRIKSALSIWDRAVPLPNTLGRRYFVERRGLHIGVLGDLSHALRWHEGIGAVVGLITDPLINEPCGIHRTFLVADGTKRERRMLGKQGVIRLSGDEDVALGLGLTEGIEDGLAVLLSGWAPIWCATSAGAIERFPVLGGIDCLTIHADFDNAGMSAAQVCVDRWIAAGREAVISFPKDLHHE